jgi:hypothetical protein
MSDDFVIGWFKISSALGSEVARGPNAYLDLMLERTGSKYKGTPRKLLQYCFCYANRGISVEKRTKNS